MWLLYIWLFRLQCVPSILLVLTDLGHSDSFLGAFGFWSSVSHSNVTPAIILGDFVTPIDDYSTTLATYFLEVFSHDFALSSTSATNFHRCIFII